MPLVPAIGTGKPDGGEGVWGNFQQEPPDAVTHRTAEGRFGNRVGLRRRHRRAILPYEIYLGCSLLNRPNRKLAMAWDRGEAVKEMVARPKDLSGGQGQN